VNDTVTFQRLIRRAKKLGKTQPEIAAALGLSLSSVEKRLAGQATVRAGELLALAAYLTGHEKPAG
jgi:transcriptional regulator with XRE-family HTH domain